jgi:hypothetical protein
LHNRRALVDIKEIFSAYDEEKRGRSTENSYNGGYKSYRAEAKVTGRNQRDQFLLRQMDLCWICVGAGTIKDLTDDAVITA